MKRFEYFKLNFNIAKNETMIATILAFIAPIIASLGEKESIRSFLMGTNGPSMLQMIAGLIILAIAVAVLIKGIIKISYDSFVSENAQIYAALPISLSDAALIKITVLSINMLILLLGLVVGMTTAWIFGNNLAINNFVGMVIDLVSSGIFERVILIPISIIFVISLTFAINATIFAGICNFLNMGGGKSRSSIEKVGLLLLMTVPMLLILGNFIRASLRLLTYTNFDNLWIYLLGITGMFIIVETIVLGIILYRINNEYYL